VADPNGTTTHSPRTNLLLAPFCAWVAGPCPDKRYAPYLFPLHGARTEYWRMACDLGRLRSAPAASRGRATLRLARRQPTFVALPCPGRLPYRPPSTCACVPVPLPRSSSWGLQVTSGGAPPWGSLDPGTSAMRLRGNASPVLPNPVGSCLSLPYLIPPACPIVACRPSCPAPLPSPCRSLGSPALSRPKVLPQLVI